MDEGDGAGVVGTESRHSERGEGKAVSLKGIVGKKAARGAA
jgi:hypothetical protein